VPGERRAELLGVLVERGHHALAADARVPGGTVPEPFQAQVKRGGEGLQWFLARRPLSKGP